MAISSVRTLEVPDACHRWLDCRGTIYQLLTEFLGHRPALSQIAQWSRSRGLAKAAEVVSGGRELLGYLSGRLPEELVRIFGREEEEYRKLQQFAKRHPLTESNYVPYVRAQDLSEVYASAGVAFKKVNGEPDDHLAIELEFMTILHDRMLYSIHCEESMLKLMDIQIRFLEEHLAVWVPALCRQLDAAVESPLYQALSHMLEEFVALDLAMLRIWMESCGGTSHLEDQRELVLA